MKHIAFSGGGMKGYCYIGVLKYLEEHNIIKGLEKISGTSIGAFIALVVALGYTYKEIKNLVLNIDFNILENFDINNMIQNYGIDDGKKVDIFLNFLLKKKKFKYGSSFKEIFEKTGIHLIMNCCDITTNTEKIFDYINTPDISVILACKYSCSIPLFLTLSEQNYIDGCFIKNLPIEVLPIEDTVGFYFVKDLVVNRKFTLPSYMSRVLACVLAKGDNLEIDKYKNMGYTLIPIKTSLTALNFTISQKDKIDNIKNGYEACQKNLNKNK
jgi:predicted acylesterase/phospholipase RssA